MVSESFQDLGGGDAASTAATTVSPAPGTASHPSAGVPGDPVRWVGLGDTGCPGVELVEVHEAQGISCGKLVPCIQHLLAA